MPRKKIVEESPEEQEHYTVLEVLAEYFQSPEFLLRAKTTQAEYRHEMTRFATWCDERKILLHQVNAKAIQEFTNHIKATSIPKKRGATEISSYTLAGQVRCIKILLNWAMDQEDYEDVVMVKVVRKIKKPAIEESIIETFTPAQIVALRTACAKEESPHLRLRDEAILLCMLDTGVRATELCTLKMANVDLSTGDSHAVVLGKGSRWGEVGLGRETRILMTRYYRQFRLPTFQRDLAQALTEQGRGFSDRQRARLEAQMLATEPFFMNRYGDPLTRNGLYRIIQRLGEWAEIQGVRCSPHTCRHTFASLSIRNGGDIRTLSKLMRHSSVQVTEDYLKSIRQWEARQNAESVVDNMGSPKQMTPVRKRKH